MPSLEYLGKLGAIIISFIAMIAFAVALILVFLNKDTFNTGIIIGAVVSNATTVVGYWLGSNSESARKTEIIASSTPVLPLVEAGIIAPSRPNPASPPIPGVL